MRFSVPFLLLVVLLVAGLASGATISVRKDGTGNFTVIQQALDVAAAGDTILIGPGQFLDKTWTRFPAWSYDIESYANVMVDNLTIIGAGLDQTFIGPSTYSGVYSTQSPKALTYIQGGDIRIEDLCLRNCYDGLFMYGTLFLNRCSLFDNAHGIFWDPVGGGWVKDTQFNAFSYSGGPLALDVGSGGTGSNILVEGCHFSGSKTIVRGVDGCTFLNCDFVNGRTALQVYSAAHVYVQSCRVSNQAIVGVELSLGSDAICEISDSEIAGGLSALAARQVGGRFSVNHSRLEGGSDALLLAVGGPGAALIQNCDLVKGSGPIVRCGAFEPAVIHDLRNNYWGTTSESDIQFWIIDSSDDPNIHATVLYSPFAGQSVPSETTTWGDLKALWR